MLGFLTAMQLLLTVKLPALMTKFMMFLTGTEAGEAAGEAINGLDMQLVSDIMDMVVTVVTKFASLFTIWPLNLILILSLIGFCTAFFFKGKKGVRV